MAWKNAAAFASTLMHLAYAQEINDTFSERRSSGTGKEILDGWNVEL